jgi:hypothetical protein
MSQKIEFFINTAVRTGNPTQYHIVYIRNSQMIFRAGMAAQANQAVTWVGTILRAAHFIIFKKLISSDLLLM